LGFILVMGDEDEGGFDAPLDLLQEDLHLAPEACIQRGKRFVEQDQFRLANDGTRQGHALLLAARQLRGIAVAQGRKPDNVERLVDKLLRRRAIAALNQRSIAGILRNRHMGKERIVLEDGVERAAVGRHGGDVGAIEGDPAAGGCRETADQAQDCRLAGARRPKKG
jgi:hypothetical protein